MYGSDSNTNWCNPLYRALHSNSQGRWRIQPPSCRARKWLCSPSPFLHPEWASITPPTAATSSLEQFYLWIIQNTLSDSLIMQDEQETEKTWLNPPVCSARFFSFLFFQSTGFLAHSHTSFHILNFSSKFHFLISHLPPLLSLSLLSPSFCLIMHLIIRPTRSVEQVPLIVPVRHFFMKMFPVFFSSCRFAWGC